ncbi:putative membrane protein [Pseudomonas syringae pv. maculicola]|nr:putative membrane protein [Pseudomonas syringae pv. maculicola]
MLHTNDYLEYYLTLVGWLINGGIWNMIEDSGLFAAPFAAIVISEWLRARGEGADEGNKGVLSLARVENRFYTAILVIILACMPLVNVSIDTIQFDRSRSEQCQYSIPKPLVVVGFLHALNGGRMEASGSEPGCWNRSVQIC